MYLIEDAALSCEFHQVRSFAEGDPAVGIVRRVQYDLSRLEVSDEEWHVDDPVLDGVVERVELACGEQLGRGETDLFSQLTPRRIGRALTPFDRPHHDRPRSGEYAVRAPNQEDVRVIARAAQDDDRHGIRTPFAHVNETAGTRDGPCPGNR